MHHDAGLLQSQKLLGIRQPEPARRLERLGHIRDLTGGTDAEHRAEANDQQIAVRHLDTSVHGVRVGYGMDAVALCEPCDTRGVGIPCGRSAGIWRDPFQVLARVM